MRKLKNDQVDIWILNAQNPKELPDVLSGDELAYLQKMSSEASRESYRNSRNTLRWILSDYLAEEPKKIRFDYGAHGKPFIRLPKTKVQFNLSHSKELTLFAVSHRALGVDIEKIQCAGTK